MKKPIQPITTSVRRLNQRLWEIYVKRGPLTAKERALVEQAERNKDQGE
jgi:hypothetical protein